jgi:cytochrome d ubiquinol oxidase subunit II
MHLTEVPLVVMLAGLTAYVVLGGADFGAGFWQLTGGGGERGRAIREHAHHAMGPVWEANHVWLIFVLVVCWTAYPTAFGSITSTLAVPLFVAGIGIILRGTAYALRSGTATPREQRMVEVTFAISSILTPFALGAVVGGIASGRVPVGNAAGDLWSSWLNPTSALVGTLTVATAAYLAAVYLAADAVRAGHGELASAFRARALGTGIVAGAVAVAGLPIVRHDARPIWDGLTSGAGLAAVVVSAAAGCATLALVWRSRFEAARATAALAVAAIVVGWALAQRPQFLPGLSIDEAAADRGTLVAVVVAIAIGAVVLVPSLALLFGLVLRGRFDAPPALPPPPERRGTLALRDRSLIATATASLAAGLVLMLLVEASWARVVGVVALFAFVVSAFLAVAPAVAAGDDT